MTEREERRTGSGKTEDNESTRQGKPEESATTEAIEEEERTGGPGGTEDTVRDESDESQQR
jgi:hypothetical protein